jgi:hypothetical protein
LRGKSIHLTPLVDAVEAVRLVGRETEHPDDPTRRP